MTAPRRILPASQAREMLDLLAEYGVRLDQCAIDIGPDGIKVSPPANQNGGGEKTLADYINRTAHRPQAADKR